MNQLKKKFLYRFVKNKKRQKPFEIMQKKTKKTPSLVKK